MTTPLSSKATTLAAQEAIPLSTPKRVNRGILSSTTTASLYSKDHDCSKINKENTYIKTTARCLFTMFRFCLSYAFSCTTSRGHTNYQGAQSNCDTRCQAAHAAISPNLQDNTHSLSRSLIEATPYDQLSVIQQKLVERCLRLSPVHIQQLSDPSQAKRKEFLSQHTHPSFPLLHAGAFNANSVGYMRNVTFEGPTAGNRIDCYLESMLRPLEDRLSNECTEETKDPKTALEEFHTSYTLCLQELEDHLTKASKAATALKEAESAMEIAETNLRLALEKESLSSEQRSDYKDKVSNYLTCWKVFAEFNGKGCPGSCHKQITESLKAYYPPFVLRGINALLQLNKENIINLLKNHLAIMTAERTSASSKPNWNAWTQEILLRQEEVSYQKHILALGFQDIYELCKMEISSKDENGMWTSPSRPKLAQALIDRLNESPQAPSIRKRTRESLGTNQPHAPELNPNPPKAKKTLFPPNLPLEGPFAELSQHSQNTSTPLQEKGSS